MKRVRSAVIWVLSGVLALLFVASGAAKLASPRWADRFVDWGYPGWFVLVVAVAEIAAGLGLLVPRVRPQAALVLIVVMLGATATHVVHAEWPRVVVTFVISALLVGLWTMSRPRTGTAAPKR